MWPSRAPEIGPTEQPKSPAIAQMTHAARLRRDLDEVGFNHPAIALNPRVQPPGPARGQSAGGRGAPTG